MSMDNESTKTMTEVRLIEAESELSRVTNRCVHLEEELRLLRMYLRGLNVNPTVEHLKEIYQA